MDIEPQKTQMTSDDQDLAKALAGITADDDAKATVPELPNLSDNNETETIAPEVPAPVTPIAPVAPAPVAPAMPTPTVAPAGDLDSIKKDALSELRPLVDKLTLEPQEMFDTYLLLIRSTDDKALIAPAHAAAQKITDESKKAQALLEIVKEIDYLSNLS